MSRWLVIAARAVAVVAVVLAGPTTATATTPEPPDTVATSENAFVPEGQELSDCLSALPPPDCGSESRGGWRQALVLVAIAAGLALVAWRIARSWRRRAT